jgi:hypothetical protein
MHESNVHGWMCMRIVALIEVWVVLLAGVTACGPLNVHAIAHADATGASKDQPTSKFECSPVHLSVFGNQVAAKEGSLSARDTQPCRIAPTGLSLVAKADTSFVHSTSFFVVVSTASQQSSLLFLSCFLII